MPVLSTFYGIIVRMYKEVGGKHNTPHLHAEYSGDEVVVALDGTVIEGKIPTSKMKLLYDTQGRFGGQLETSF